MSVQAGHWNFDGQPPDRELLFRINRAVAEHGPDGERSYFDSSLGMLYRPFHTTAESRLERQPHVSASGKVMTWDGRLDNREEILTQLEEPPDRYKTDVAIAGAAFDRWETGCFAKFVGDWALAMWDSNSRELLLARDYAGIRHLFYYLKSNAVVWCTHLKPLVLCGEQFHLCDEYIAGFFALWPEAHRTPYNEIHAVPPGHFVRISDRAARVVAYWHFNPRLTIRYKTDMEYEEHFRQLFRQAVRQRMRTDSPILADLSGGLDSSSIVCMADDIVAKEVVETPSVDTFTALIRDEPGEEDSRYFTAVEQKRGRIGHRVEVCGGNGRSPFDLPDFAAIPGLRGRPELNTAKTEVIRRGGYKVVLSGTGGDEMLGQALNPRVQLADLLRRFQFGELAKQLSAWSLLLRRPWIHLFFEAVLLQLPTCIRILSSDTAKVDPWINSHFAKKHGLSARQLDLTEGSLAWRPSTRDWFQTINTLITQMAATHPSIEETRYPYLDRRLVEFLMSIPTGQILRPGQRRSLMRRALADLVPDEILKRRTKSGSTRYYSVALAHHWHQLRGTIQPALISNCGYVNQEEFLRALVDAKNGNLSPCFLRLFRALSLELWLRKALAVRAVAITQTTTVSVGDDLVQPAASPFDSCAPGSMPVSEIQAIHTDLASEISSDKGPLRQERKEVNTNELQQT